MQLCLDCLTGSCGGILEHGPVMGPSLLPRDPEMGESCCSDGPGMGLLDAWMVLERVLCLCVWGRCGVCCSNVFSLVLLMCNCGVK